MLMVDRLDKRSLATGFIVLLSLLLAMGNAMNPLVELPSTGTDSSVFRTVAMIMQHGGMPYLDSFDHKGPLLYVYYYLGMELSYNHGVWLFAWLSLLFTLVFMYRIARLWLRRPEACLIAGAGAVFTLRKFYESGGLTEDFAMPYIAMALYYFIAYFQGKEISADKWFLMGWGFMSVALLRVNMVVPFLLFPFVIAVKEWLTGNYKRTIRNMATYLLGFLLLGLLIGGWLYQRGALDACIADYIQFNMAYSADPERASIKNKIKSLVYFAVQPLVLLSLLTMLDRCLLTVRKWLSFDVLYAVYICFALMAICISGQTYGHYGMVLVPLTVYPLVIIWKSLQEYTNDSRQRFWLAGVAIVLVLLLAKPIAGQLYGVHKAGYNSFDVRANKNLAELITEIEERTVADDKISVFGNNDIIYIASHRLPVGVYSYQSPIINVDNRIADKYFAELSINKPKLIIFVDRTTTSSLFAQWTEQMNSFIDLNGYEEVYHNAEYTVYEWQGEW